MIASKTSMSTSLTMRRVFPVAGQRPTTRSVTSPASRSRSGEVSSSAICLPLLSMLAAAPAFAEEAAPEAAEAVAMVGPMSAVEFGVLLTPIGLYGIWSVYRQNINPRSTFNDYLLFLALSAIIANLVSIIAFQTRLF